MNQPDLFSGSALRDAGIALVDANEDDAWKDRADRAIRQLAYESWTGGATFTAEDVRRIAGDPSRANSMGSRFLAATKRGLIHCVGYTRSTRPEAHACRLSLYQGTDKVASQ